MKITPKLLKRKKACQEQYEIFVKQWPDGCAVNAANAKIVAKLGLDLYWVVGHLLSADQRADYWAKHKPLWEDYQAKRKPLDDDYWAKRKPLWEDYLAKRKPLYEDYRAKHKFLDEDYWAKRKPMDEDLEAKTWKLLATIITEGSA